MRISSDHCHPSQRHGAKTAAVALVGFLVVGCGRLFIRPEPAQTTTSTEVPAGEEAASNIPASQAFPAAEGAPAIVSIKQSPGSTSGTIILLIEGTGFDRGAVAEIYNSSGKLQRSAAISGVRRGDKGHHVSLSGAMRHLPPGRYTVRVRSPSGRYSNAEVIAIAQPAKPEECSGNFSKSPKVLYLGGGEAGKLFEGYLSQDGGIGSSLPRDLKIKFHGRAKPGEEASLQIVGLQDMEQMFVESQDDFLGKLKKRLNGQIAEPDAALADQAQREHGDHYLCIGRMAK